MLILVLYNVELFVLLVILVSLVEYLFRRFKAGVINLFMLAFATLILAETAEAIYEQVRYLEGTLHHEPPSVLIWLITCILHILSYTIIGYLLTIKDFGVHLTRIKEENTNGR